MKPLLTILFCCLFSFFGFCQSLKSFKDKNTGFIGFTNEKGEIIIAAKYQDRYGVQVEGMIMVSKDDKWGYVDFKGNEVVVCKYEKLSLFNEGLAAASINGIDYGYIDKAGNLVIPFKYSGGGFFREGSAPVKFGGKWGFIDKKNNNVIDYRYEYASPFKEGFASIKKDDKWGFIDKTGKEVFGIKYDRAYDFSEGFAAVIVGGKFTFINRSGKEIIEPLYDQLNEFKEGFARVKLNGGYGFIDKIGNQLLEPIYNDVCDFNEGFARVTVKLNGKWLWGYIDTKGNFINKDAYGRDSKDFDQGFAIVTYSGMPTKGVISRTGKKIIPLIYNSVSLNAGVFKAEDDYGQIFKFDTLGNRVTKKRDVFDEIDLLLIDEPTSDQLLSHIDFSGGYTNDDLVLKKVNNYLDYNTSQNSPATLMKAVDKLLSKAANNKKSYQDFSTYIFNRYLNPPQPCLQAISVHIVLDYYCNPAAPFGGAFWVDKKQLDQICEGAKKTEPVPCD